MIVVMWEHHIFDNWSFGCDRVCCPDPINITNFVQSLMLSYWFENNTSANFGL
jgi:hypothetical protein